MQRREGVLGRGWYGARAGGTHGARERREALERGRRAMGGVEGAAERSLTCSVCVARLADMFYSASAFNQDINGWVTSRVTSMQCAPPLMMGPPQLRARQR